MNIKSTLIFMMALSPIAYAGKIPNISVEEKDAQTAMTYGHSMFQMEKPAEGCYDVDGKLSNEGAETVVKGIRFTCISKKPAAPAPQYEALRKAAIDAGVATPKEKFYLWFLSRAVDYCKQNDKRDLETCIRELGK